MRKLPIGVLATVVLIVIVGWAASTYFPVGVNHPSTGTSATSATTSGIGATSDVTANSQSAPSGKWLSDTPALVGNLSTIDYPPDYAILANFTLGLINNDRAAARQSPVALSSVPSGQQHADSMAYYGYFSHWDIQGYKPYMRYTLLGGTGSVTENAALNYCSTSASNSSVRISAPCSLQRIENAINDSEWSMMNNDTTCCNNGHRENILAPIHNRVSVGVAYNSTVVYLVEDFEDSYISSASLHLSGGVVTFQGSIPMQQEIRGWLRNASGAEVSVFYDPIPGAINSSELAVLTSCDHYNELSEPAVCQYQGAYNPGTQISTVFRPCPVTGVCAPGDYTYAQTWKEVGGSFDIVFSISALVSAHGNGVYTFYLWPAASAPEPITSLSVFVTGV